MADELIGKLMGKYELRERIGRGGMAEVYKAYHASLDRYVALKVLHPFLSEDTEFKERFEREARNVAQLRHPNIVQVYDFDLDPGPMLYYMVMEYINGPTLRSRLMQRSFENALLPTDEAIRITRDLASALAYAHSRDMVHRDIKPSNIMLDSDGRVVLTDFGIARIISGPHMTASGSMVGTPAYMSPEQGLGQPGDHRSDIYSLGVVLYQLITGSTPYDADTPIAIILKHVNDPLPPPSDINPEIPNGLELVIYKALAKSPEERYQDVEEMVRHLSNLKDVAGSLERPKDTPYHAPTSTAPATTAPAIEPKPRSSVLTWVFLTILSLIALAGGFYVAFMGLLSETVAFLPPAEIVLTSTPSPTPTSALADTPTPAMPTPDIQATEINLTIEAISTMVVSPVPNGNPDLTATFTACDYDYELVSEDPPAGSRYPELTTLTKFITIVNDSRCPLDDDTRFVFKDGLQLGGPDFVEFNRELQPGEEFTIILSLMTPQLNPANPTIRSAWIVALPGGIQVGPEYILELTLVPAQNSDGEQPTPEP